MAQRVSPISVPVRVNADQLPSDISNVSRQLGQMTSEIERQFQKISSKSGMSELNFGAQTNQVRKLVRSAALGNYNEGHMQAAEQMLSNWQTHAAMGISGASGNVSVLQTLMQRMLANKMGPLTSMSAIGSPLWSNQVGAESSSITQSLATQNMLRRLQGIESSIESGGKPTQRMIQDLQEIDAFFKKTTQSANQFREAIGRLEIAKGTLGHLLPPETSVARHRMGPAGMTSFATVQGTELDPLNTRLSQTAALQARADQMTGLMSDPYGLKNRRASDMMIAGMSSVGMPDPGLRAAQMEALQSRADQMTGLMSDPMGLRNRRASDRMIAGMSGAGRPRQRLGPMGMTDVEVLTRDNWYDDSSESLRNRQRAWDEGVAHNRWLQEQGPIGPRRGIGPNRGRLRDMTDEEKRMVEPRWQTENQRIRYQLHQQLKNDGDEFDLASLQRRLGANQAMAAKGLMTSSMGVQNEFLANRISAIQSNPVLNQMGAKSGFRGNSLTAMNIGYGLEDFIIASQYGGVPMGIRAAVNNVTPIIANAVMAGRLGTWAGPMAIGGAALGASAIAIGTEMHQRSIERAAAADDRKINAPINARTFDRQFSRQKAAQDLSELSGQRERIEDKEYEINTADERIAKQRQYRIRRAAKMSDFMYVMSGQQSADTEEGNAEEREMAANADKRVVLTRARQRLAARGQQLGNATRFGQDYDQAVYGRNWNWEGRNWLPGVRGTISQMSAESENLLDTEIRSAQETFRKSDGGLGAVRARDEAVRNAQQGFWTRRLDIRKQGREQFQDIREQLTDAMKNLPGEASMAEDLARKIMGNDQTSNREKLDNMILNRDLLQRNIKNLRTGQGQMLPEQMAIEQGSMEDFQMKRRLTAPQETVDQKILDVLNDINAKIEELMKKVGVV